MQKTNKSATGTSFHDVTINISINELKAILGNPTFKGDYSEDKVTHEWVCETERGQVVTIYDWKQYRKIDPSERIDFHIGGFNYLSTVDAKEELEYELYTLS